MRRYAIFIIIFYTVNESFANFSEDEIIIINELGKFFKFKYCVIFSSNYKNKNVFIKNLSALNYYSVYYDEKMLVNNLLKLNPFMDKLAIIVHFDDEMEALNILEKYFKHHYSNPGSYSRIISQYTWILFSQQKKLEIFIPFDCQFIVINLKDHIYQISELYQLRTNSKQLKNELGEFKNKNWLTFTNSSFYQRRLNFNGYNMHIGKLSSMRSLGYWTNCHREILHDIGNILNSTVTESIIKLNHNNEMDLSITPHIDVGMVPIVIHSDYFDRDVFGPTFMFVAYMHIKYETDSRIGFEAYFRPFHKNVWISIFFLLIVSTIVTVILEYFSISNESNLFSIIRNFGFSALDSLSDQADTSDSKFWKTKFSILFPKISTYIILSCYSGAIIAFLTVQYPKIPFHNFEELSTKENYKIFSVRISFIRVYISTNKNPTILRVNQMWIDKESFPYTEKEGVDILCETNNHVFIAYNDEAMSAEDPPCKILKIQPGLFKINSGMQLGVNSSFINIFKRMLRRFYYNGEINRMISKFKAPQEAVNEKSYLVPLDLSKVVFILGFIPVAVMVSVIIFLVEILININENNDKDDYSLREES